jgi:hypothetical protein
MTPFPGEIYRHEAFYVDEKTGKSLPKFLLILAAPKGDDIVFRLLTSRDHARRRCPRCDPSGSYPGFYLGSQLCDELPLDTWIDLRRHPDYDAIEFHQRNIVQEVRKVHTLSRAEQRKASLCAATAPDTSIRQTTRIMNSLN